MTIKVRERSDKDLFIRCNTKQEKEFVMMMFLEMKQAPRMYDKVIVKDIKGRELKLPKKEVPIPEEPKAFVDGVST